MATKKLTKRTIDSLRPTDEADYFVWDAELKGFGLRVSPRGRKTFVVGYRPIGSRQSRRLSVGSYGTLTVEEARRMARKQLASVADGNDPSERRREERDVPLVRELGTDYLLEVDARKKTSTATEYRRMWDKHVVPALGNLKVSRVPVADVERLHRAMHKTPYMANRVLAMLGAFFTFASRHGLRARHDNPAWGVDAYPEEGRERYLTSAEFAVLGETLEIAERDGVPTPQKLRRKSPPAARAKHRPKSADKPLPANPFAVAAIRLLALTGCREGEILSLRWDAIDFERGFLRLADTKTGKADRPLGSAAIEVLRGLPRHISSPFVFPGLKPDTHLKEIKRVWTAVREAAGLPDLRIHDLRHSYASVSAVRGDSLLVIRSLLGHSDIATTQRYAHLGDNPVKLAADATSGSIAAMLGQRSNLTA